MNKLAPLVFFLLAISLVSTTALAADIDVNVTDATTTTTTTTTEPTTTTTTTAPPPTTTTTTTTTEPPTTTTTTTEPPTTTTTTTEPPTTTTTVPSQSLFTGSMTAIGSGVGGMLSEMSLPTTIFLILLGIVGTIGAIIIWATKNAW